MSGRTRSLPGVARRWRLRSPAAVVGVARAFLERSVLVALSYRTRFALGIGSLGLSVATFLFVGKAVALSGTGFVERYGIGYTEFALVGTIVHGAAVGGLGAFRAAVRREQVQGTLETLACAPVPLPVSIALSGLADSVVLGAGAGVAFAVVGWRAGLSPAEFGTALGAFVLYAAAMCGLGLASAGVVLVTKQGDPVSWIVAATTGLLGGVYFPIDLLPRWLSGAAGLLPTTHALSVVRGALGVASGAAPNAGAASSVRFLAVTAALSLSVGVLVLRWGERRALRFGTLAEY